MPRALIDLKATDFNGKACRWPNRADRTGSSNFVCTVPACVACQQPVLSLISGVPAVVVNATQTYPGFAIPGSLSANTTDASFDAVYGGNAWTFEAWVQDIAGYRGGQHANMLFRWAPTDTPDCASASVSLGDTDGYARSAGGHWMVRDGFAYDSRQ